MTQNTPSAPGTPLPLAPWVLIDDTTLEQTAMLLERLVEWMSADDAHTRECADALSLGETTDVASIASWIDCLAARLRRCAEGRQL